MPPRACVVDSRPLPLCRPPSGLQGTLPERVGEFSAPSSRDTPKTEQGARSQAREPDQKAKVAANFPLHISDFVYNSIAGDGVRHVTALGADNSYTDLLARRSCRAVTDQTLCVCDQMSCATYRVFGVPQCNGPSRCVTSSFR
jgi:hypothetical protein